MRTMITPRYMTETVDLLVGQGFIMNYQNASRIRAEVKGNGEQIMITTKNRIGYIQRRYDENNVPHFKFIVAKIKRVNIGVKSTKVYTKEFYPLDLEDLESTTEMFDTSKGIIIVQEPFILKDDEEEYFQAVVDKWNEEPPKSIFD